MKSFDIPISRNYIDNWGITEALREIRANSEDGSLEPDQYGTQFNNEGGNVFCWNYSEVKLTPATLVLGNSSKSNDDNNIGQFGEGYKLALVVLLREGKKVKIHNLDEIWHASFKESEQFGTETLHIEVEPLAKSSEIIAFDIDGITVGEYTDFETILLTTHLEHLKPIFEVEGKYKVYSIEEAIDAASESYNTQSKLLSENRFSLSQDDIELMNFSLKETNEATRELRNIRGTYVGGIKVKHTSSDLIVDLHPSVAKLSRDRDSFTSKHDYVREARTKAIVSNMDSLKFSKSTLNSLMDMEFLRELSDSGKAALLKEVTDILELKPIDNIALAISGSSVVEEAKKLGIKLPSNAGEFTWEQTRLLQTLGLTVKDFEHPILTNNLRTVVTGMIEKHMPMLSKEGNEILLKDFNIIRTLTEETYRGM